jgi:hypothetical protein
MKKNSKKKKKKKKKTLVKYKSKQRERSLENCFTENQISAKGLSLPQLRNTRTSEERDGQVNIKIQFIKYTVIELFLLKFVRKC